MISIAVIEDEKLFFDQLYNHISKWARKAEQKVAISAYLSADSFMLDWDDKDRYDVIFIDVMLPGVFNGIELSRHIRKRSEDVAIIFVTSVAEEMQKGFDVAALQYLIKPIDEADIQKCMDKVLKRKKKPREAIYFFYKNKNAIAKIPYKDILYFSSALHYTEIYTVNGVEKQLERLKNIEEKLPKQFVRCHRSVIVNINSIYSISQTTITLIDHTTIHASKTYIAALKEKIIEYFD